MTAAARTTAPAPAEAPRLEDLSRAELLHLVRRHMPFVRAQDLCRARWDALCAAQKAAGDRWEAQAGEAQAAAEACAAAHAAGRPRAERLTLEAKYQALRAEDERLWEASRRTHAAQERFYKRHLDKPSGV